MEEKETQFAEAELLNFDIHQLRELSVEKEKLAERR